ncbi:2-amino-4-hydroxy-6-hydroxymethyldihydropteridinepyrophosphokinase [Chlamydiales bacterium SCGC AG-110-P3]|nr:2-amino-4-hydroxy-6-hydroxymethyldihydropteridinepyrophosphokinase [Chlamydiales bacterium SCGC AG-110-P3]
MESLVFISIGGNVGDSVSVIMDAVSEMREWSEITDLQISKLYSTSPISSVKQVDFVNGVISFYTTLSPLALMERCWKLERQYGLKEPIKHGPRVLDIDLIFFDKEQMDDDYLTVPHPCWRDRLFVLIPLFDLVDKVTVPRDDGGVEYLSMERLVAAAKLKFPDQSVYPVDTHL